jgi:UDP-N-acetyl-D-mannosaminuronic acid transferase (WecB/TagA/CpsF family)
MGPGAISVRRINEDASWERQAFLPASRYVLGMRVDATSYQDATEQAVGLARRSESPYVCVAAVNKVMQAHDDERFPEAMNRADLATPDGMPFVWGLRWLPDCVTPMDGSSEAQLREADRIPAAMASAAAER